jgi:hypothetical protein
MEIKIKQAILLYFFIDIATYKYPFFNTSGNSGMGLKRASKLTKIIGLSFYGYWINFGFNLPYS